MVGSAAWVVGRCAAWVVGLGSFGGCAAGFVGYGAERIVVGIAAFVVVGVVVVVVVVVAVGVRDWWFGLVVPRLGYLQRLGQGRVISFSEFGF